MPIYTSIAYKDLLNINDIKTQLRTVIADKGVDISASTPFEEYPQKIASISGSDTPACILKIVPTPSDATVTFTERDNFLNETACLQGHSIEYTVSKTGYTTVTASEIMDQSKQIAVVLEAE